MRRIFTILFLLILNPHTGQSQQAEITPTVTQEMGDVGGTFFGQSPNQAKTRHYYIAAEPELWDYTPEGRDPICGKLLPPDVVAKRHSPKIRYIEYTDATFTTRAIQNPRLGILGPVLRGLTGDYLAVTFLNRALQPLSMHPHGVKYDKDSEGALYDPAPGRGAAIGTGATFTYVWHLDQDSAPLPTEPSSKAWLYHSHVVPDEEAMLGLVGFIIVTDPDRAKPDGTPKDVDREMASLFLIHDESGLGPAAKEAWEYANIPGAPPALTFAETAEALEIGKRYAINGRIFGNLTGLEMIEGERVRWYTFGLGDETDVHTAHWHGETVIEDGHRRTDVIELFPASMKVADMTADNPGSWLFHCHVAEHMNEGMFTRYIIHPKKANARRPALENPYFGQNDALQSIHIKKLTYDRTTSTTTLRAELTVANTFSMLANPVSLTIGETRIPFPPNNEGHSKSTDTKSTLRIWNPCEFGVVYGGMLDIEITTPGKITPPLIIQVGKATHRPKPWQPLLLE
jgi:hypothetical protein